MSFDLYRLSEEHEAIRDAVREVCADKVAPNAAEADETGEFPKASYDALRASDFHAPHIPEEYGGAGADALATALVIEEVARVCASSSLIPAVNKLGSMALLLAGSEELKTRYLRPLGRGDLVATFGPEDLLAYIYALFHSPGYREKYADALRSDFPHILTPSSSS